MTRARSGSEWRLFSRREAIAAAVAGLTGFGVGKGFGASVDEDAGEFVLRSQSLPQPHVILPTDGLSSAERGGPVKRIAAVVTSYFRYSHADDIVTKFMEGYSIVGRTHKPHCAVVSLSIEQTGPQDIGRPFAARYNIPVFKTPAEAVMAGTDRLAVDGVLLIGEHGEYPFNGKGQHLYPRRRLFEEIVGVFQRSGRSVPVYNDKHFSYDWLAARWMYEQSRNLKFAMMAGSSVPVAWRRPALALKHGVPLEGALAVGFSGTEVYGFHTLELLQAFAEKRRGGETGIAAVRCLEGAAAWDAAAEGLWNAELLRAAIRMVPGGAEKVDAASAGIAGLRRADPNAVVFLVDYQDGFRGAAYVSRGLVEEFAFAAKVKGRANPVATWCELNKPQRDHFSFLCNHIEVMFRTGRASYPVERTLLVTGALSALMDSHAEGGVRIRTPHLAEAGYTPATEITVPAGA